ncbi:MAG: metallophosphoesterase, partial [Phycisphaerae bacterium]|nr:metallophosphoesterase [Phycisphaerae bacterium]
MNDHAPRDVLRIAVVTDFHFANKSAADSSSARKSHLAGPLLQRAINRFNRYIKPDVVLVPGDLLKSGKGAKALEDLAEVKEMLEALEAPTIVLPGNHDPGIDEFYAVMGPRRDYLDVKGYRIIPFCDDLDFPDFSGARRKEDIERLGRLSRSFEGRTICCQHMSLHPPGAADVDFNLTNADEVIRGMLEAGVLLSIGAHFHRGAPLLEHSGCSFLSTPTMCEHPFRYQIIEIQDGQISVETEPLSLPPRYPWYDYHVHTNFAYCVADKGNEETVELAEATGIALLGFAEHSGQLYFANSDDDNYWRRMGGCFRDSPGGAALADLPTSRMERFLETMQPYRR